MSKKRIECNLPFERLPACHCDQGFGPAPTRLQMLECAMAGGPCRTGKHPDEGTPQEVCKPK